MDDTTAVNRSKAVSNVRPTDSAPLEFGGPLIIRTYKNRANPYAQIHRGVLEDSRLSWAARGVMAYLLAKPDNWVVQPGDLQRNGRCGRDAIRSIFKELEDCGYLLRHRVNHSSGQFGWTYRVYESPDLNPEYQRKLAAEAPAPPSPEKPSMVEPSPVRPSPGKPSPVEPSPVKASSYQSTDLLNNHVLKNQEQKTHTQIGNAPAPVVVCASSRFSLEDCKQYAEHLKQTGQGITNPGGYATKIFRTGEADSSIERFIAEKDKPNINDCPDCAGRCWIHVDPADYDKGVKHCQHERLLKRAS